MRRIFAYDIDGNCLKIYTKQENGGVFASGLARKPPFKSVKQVKQNDDALTARRRRAVV